MLYCYINHSRDEDHLENTCLCALITTVCGTSPSDMEIKPFIDTCAHIAAGYLAYKESRGYYIARSRLNRNREIESLAIDLIAELFKRDDAGTLVVLKKYFSPLLLQNPSEKSLYISLRRLITNQIEQGLSRLFKERDPETAKIIKNIRLAAVKNSRLNLIKHNGIMYISCSSSEPLCTDIDYSIVSGILLQAAKTVFKPADTVPVLLEKLFDCNGVLPRPHLRLPLHTITNVIREYRQHIEYEQTVFEHASPEINGHDILVYKEYSDRIRAIEKVILNKVDTAYSNRGKLDPEHIFGLKTAFGMYIQDLIDGELPENHYCYIRKALPRMSLSEYNATIRKQFEYLLKLFRGKIRSSLFSDSEA